MLNNVQLLNDVITPTLSLLQKFSDDAANLLMFTCAVESDGGTFVRQVKGPALGIYQMEPKTYNDIWFNYIRLNSQLPLILSNAFGIHGMPSEDRMIYDLQYSTIMTRLHYSRVKEALPDRNSVEAVYAYYKKYYNTPMGKATFKECVSKWDRFMGLEKKGKGVVEKTLG